jgi:hypothetical protein
MQKTWFVLVLFCLFLTGCGAKTNVVTPYQFDSNSKLNFELSKHEKVEMPAEELATIKKQIQDGLTEKKLFENNPAEQTRVAEIKITSYRMRPDAARLLVGAMAGCDNIKSNVAVIDTKTKERIGESEIMVEECAAWGVSSQVIAAYSKEVVEYLSGKK